jgi:Cof subfamily protein (haloacid dehalogenase superfamily)
MDLSKIKLVVSDMDGTLLNSNHEVSPLFFELFKELRKHHILFVAASGRPYYGIIEKLDIIKDDIIIIAENGGLVVDNNTIISSTPINTHNIDNIEQVILANHHMHPIYCTKSKAYFKGSSNGYITSLSEYYPNFYVINDIKEIAEDIIKIALYHPQDSEKYIYPYFKALSANYKIIVSGKHWVDISDNNANKGIALELLQNVYNVTSEETLVFGDYNNDLDMLKRSKYSFAMDNAHKNVKETASYRTKSNNEYGVELILEKLIKAKQNV